LAKKNICKKPLPTKTLGLRCFFFSDKNLGPQKTGSKNFDHGFRDFFFSLLGGKTPHGWQNTWHRDAEATKTPGPGKYLAHEVEILGLDFGLEMSFLEVNGGEENWVVVSNIFYVHPYLGQ